MHNPSKTFILKSNTLLPRMRNVLRFISVLTLTLVLPALLEAQVTFAGTQVPVAGGAAFPLSRPSGVAVDGTGNLYIADTGNNRILMVTPAGDGYTTPVVIASGFSSPTAVASDWTGDVFVADTGNNQVVLLAMTSKGRQPAVTIASGMDMPSGVAVDGSENLYVSDTGNNRILELAYINGSYGAAVPVASGFSAPTQISVDAKKTLYIADTGNSRIVKEPLTATGYTTPQYLRFNSNTLTGVSVDRNLNVWVSENGTGLIAQDPWNYAGNRYNNSFYAGGGFSSPQGLIADTRGNVFVADAAANTIVKLVNASVNFSSAAVGQSPLQQTYEFTIAAGTTLGTPAIYTQGGTGQDFNDAGGSTCQAEYYAQATLCVVKVAFSPLGSGERKGAIVLYDPSGNPLATAFISGVGTEPQAGYIPGTLTYLGTGLSGPSGVAVDGNGDVFISDTGNDRVVEVPLGTAGYGSQKVVLTQGISSPMGLAIDGADNLYVVSNGNDKVVKLPWLGTQYGAATKVGSGFYGPSTVAVDGVGNVYVADTLDSALWMVPWNGTGYGWDRRLGNYTKFPFGIAVDHSGSLYFTSPYQNLFVKVPAVGGSYQPQQNYQLQGSSFPSAMVVDGDSNLYVLDSVMNRVVMMPWTGSGFGTQVTVASGFNSPSGIAVDASGNLYVADTGNNQVVKIDLSNPGPLSFPSTYVGSSSPQPLTTVVENIGNEPLILASVTYPADFPVNANANDICEAGTVLNQGGACDVSTSFTPLQPSAQLLESITITNNSLNVAGFQQSIPLSGSATGELTQSITFLSLSNVVYGASALPLSASSSSGLPVTYQVISGPGAIYQGKVLSLTGAGTIVIQATQAGSSSYEAAAPVRISVTVFPAVLTVSANDVSAVYGSISSSFRYNITGFVLGQSASQVISGTASVKTNATAVSGVGNYVLTPSQGSLVSANYTFFFAPGVLTVTPAPLTITAVSVSAIYGKPLPSLAWTISGLRNADTASVVTGVPSLTTTAFIGAAVGSYPVKVSQGTLVSANYSYQFSAGTLSMGQATLTVAAEAKTGIYGSKLPSLTYSITGYVLGDSQVNAVKGAPQVATNATQLSSAGTYGISVVPGTMTSVNYRLFFTGSSLTIQKAMLTVTPGDAQMVYGQPKSSFSYNISGFVNGDTARVVSGQPELSAPASQRPTVGQYAVQGTAGNLWAANYEFVVSSGKLTVSKALLTISATSLNMTYGAAVPKFTYMVTGFVNGDLPTSIAGAPSLVSNASSKSLAGTYSIEASVGSLSSPNYFFAASNGVLTIGKAMLTVVPTPVVMTYGASVPKFTYGLTGFVNGDSASTVTGLPQLTASVSYGTAAGVYAIKGALATLSSPNYCFAFSAGTVTVNKATLTVTPNPIAMTYGQAIPKLTYAISGLVNQDAASVIAGSPQISSSILAKSGAGTYSIQAGVGTLSAANYSFAVVPGTITVAKASLTVTPNNATMEYGAAVPTLLYSITGFVNGDSLAAVSGKPLVQSGVSSRTSVGSYASTVADGTLSAANYTFIPADGKVAVTPASLVVTVQNAAANYGGKTPTLAYTVAGFLNGDTQASAITGKPLLTTTATAKSFIGKYNITAAAGSMAAKNYTLQFVAGQFTVNAAPLTVTANSLAVKVGATLPSLTFTATGFQNGDTINSATSGTPSLTTTATANSGAGSYPITIAKGSMKAGNYDLTFADGALTLTK